MEYEQHLHSLVTKRGTHIEMVRTANMGIACYMDGTIQSCEADEKVYHQSLVSFAMLSVPSAKRVLVFGGGEGATVREVFACSAAVEQVLMVEWDREVVELFQNHYPQWSIWNGKSSWTDPRLSIVFEDAFEYVRTPPCSGYDVAIVDLFDPTRETLSSLHDLMTNLQSWMTKDSSVVVYMGMAADGAQEHILQLLEDITLFPNHQRIPYRFHVPSFDGDCMALLFRTM